MAIELGNSTLIQHTVTNPVLYPSFVNDARVKVTILDSHGVMLAGEPWPVILPHAEGTGGVYRRSFAPFEYLVVGEVYSVIVQVITPDGLVSRCTSLEKAIRCLE